MDELTVAEIEHQRVSRERLRGSNNRRNDDWDVSYDGSPHHPLDRTTLIYFFSSFIQNFKKWDSKHCIDGIVKSAKLCGYPQWKETPITTLVPVDRTNGEECTRHMWPAAYKALCERSQENPLVVKAFFDLFCISSKENIALFDKVRDSASLRYLLEAGNRARFEFGGLRNGHCLVQDVIVKYMLRRQYELITLLFKYGFNMGTSHDYK